MYFYPHQYRQTGVPFHLKAKSYTCIVYSRDFDLIKLSLSVMRLAEGRGRSICVSLLHSYMFTNPWIEMSR